MLQKALLKIKSFYNQPVTTSLICFENQSHTLSFAKNYSKKTQMQKTLKALRSTADASV